MPNTLAHAGAQGFASRTALPDVDLKWVYLGCVIPDVPWILHRSAHVAVTGIDPFALRSYVIIQASLLGCLVLSGAVALFAKRVWTVLAVLSGNAVLHLGIDAMQTKWGNGVHFFAPFSWKITNWGLFWPESTPTYVLTGLGLLYVVLHWRTASERPSLTWPSIPRLMVVLMLLSGYFLGPLFLLQQPIKADAHSLDTLSRNEGRTGRPVEIDRARYVHERDRYFLEYYGGQVRVKALEVKTPATVSIRGVFIDDSRVRVTRLYVHAGGLRDYPSFLGLALIAILWIMAWCKGGTPET